MVVKRSKILLMPVGLQRCRQKPSSDGLVDNLNDVQEQVDSRRGGQVVVVV